MKKNRRDCVEADSPIWEPLLLPRKKKAAVTSPPNLPAFQYHVSRVLPNDS